MSILILGCNGQVGWELQRTLSPLGRITALDIGDLDLSDTEAVRKSVREKSPALIVNAAAYTAVDKAEEEKDAAWQINAVVPGVLAEEAKALGALLIHYSTDYVYDGAKQEPYLETDPTSGVNHYGKSKLAGDEAISGSGAAHVIFRTSWVYGARGNNFLRTMLRLAREREELRVINDQTGAPTWSRHIAEATALAAARMKTEKGSFDTGGRDGVYHLTSGGEGSWYDFASEIFRLDPEPSLQKIKTIVPIPTSEYPTAAKRPVNSRLSGNKLASVFHLSLPDWRDSLAKVMEDLT